MEDGGEQLLARELERVSSHWMRLTVATAALLGGQDLSVVQYARDDRWLCAMPALIIHRKMQHLRIGNSLPWCGRRLLLTG
ncbi:hypothetical protein D0T23_26285 [Duganella sp. BJB475]|nr:hypothetical protein D0T23_26285 [Duganella sp. BJB475]RFP25453.1 hypothetical protein D0T21_28370 [Duganella sp. BJB476]